MNTNFTNILNKVYSGFSKNENGMSLDDIVKNVAYQVVLECAMVANEKYEKGFCPVGGYVKEHFGI